MYLEALKTYLKEKNCLELYDDIEVISNQYLSDMYYKYAYQNSPVGHLILDGQLQVKQVNNLANLMLEKTTPFDFESLIHDDSIDLYKHYIEKVKGSSFSIPIHLYLDINGEKKYVKLLSKSDHNMIQCILIDESFELCEKHALEVIGFRDYLTGLYNRRFFQEELIRLDVDRNYPIGLIMADVNGLKLINDAFGHNHGDDLIVETADILKTICREDDIVSRIGGDEFAIILSNTSKEEMQSLIQRLIEESESRTIGDIQISIAFGYSIKRFASDQFDQLFKRAEDEMYKHKLASSTSQRMDIINGIMKTLHGKHERELLHSNQVSQLMVKFAQAMGFGTARINNARSAGLLHDIGKIAIDYTILELDRPLTEEEMRQVQKHSEVGYRILKNTTIYGDIAKFVLYHHEQLDGSGYPRGLTEAEIPLESRMLAICDAYDAMTSKRFYKATMTKDEAIEELLKCSGKQFDKLLLEIFINKVL